MRVRGMFAAAVVGLSMGALAQNCTTQARMPATTRTALADAALMLGSAVKSNDAKAVKAATIAAYTENFAPVQYAIESTSEKLRGDSLRVTQVYLLDASNRAAADTREADFTCLLAGSSAETDFAIPGLTPGVYGFAMVEATGDRPWLLSFLLEQSGSAWKMAGFYAHARTAAGKDGVWYWTDARAKVAAKQPWLGWMEYGEAAYLLSPAVIAGSTNLDKLHNEQRLAAPAGLADGLSADAPLVIKGADGKEFRFTSMANEIAPDGQGLHLVLHYAGDPLQTTEANRARNLAAAKALLTAHPELRQGFGTVIVFADIPGQNPSVLSVPMAEVPVS